MFYKFDINLQFNPEISIFNPRYLIADRKYRNESFPFENRLLITATFQDHQDLVAESTNDHSILEYKSIEAIER